MPVSAILTDIAIPPRDMVGELASRRLLSTGFDFAALLSGAQVELALAPDAVGFSPATIDGSTLKTEVSRTVSTVGHVRTTIIGLADGTTRTEIVTISGGEPLQSMPVFSPVDIRPLAATIRADSDLEPELRPEGERRDENASLRWKGKKGIGAGRRDALAVLQRPFQVATAPREDDADRGRLIDILG